MSDNGGSAKRFAAFAAANRSVWFMMDDRKLYAGFWEVQQAFDDETMVLRGLPNWPKETPDWIEVHKIKDRQRQDRHDIANLEQAFYKVLAIRPVKKEPTSKISDDPADPQRGNRVVFSFDENDPQHTELRLSEPFLRLRFEIYAK